MVLPHPTSPYMYSPLGRASGIVSSCFALRPNSEPKNDLGLGSRDSTLGWTTGGGL